MDQSHVILKRWPRSDLIRPYLSSQQEVQLVAFCLKQGEQAVEDAKAYVESRWGDLYRLIRVVGTVSCDSEKDKYLVQRNFKEGAMTLLYSFAFCRSPQPQTPCDPPSKTAVSAPCNTLLLPVAVSADHPESHTRGNNVSLMKAANLSFERLKSNVQIGGGICSLIDRKYAAVLAGVWMRYIAYLK